ncbi:MAG: integrase [Mogibacterium sp.]|nr:integrase [Mogibacterium sp.]MBQ6501662.1 integrase [Mogibacterium sp.]
MTESETTTRRTPDIEIIEDDSFSYDGFQVVRGEFFSHIYEPSFTLNQNKISVNMACVRKLPDVEYVQALVHPEEKMLIIRPCHEEEKDSFRWRSAGKKLSPKQVTCKIFFAKIFTLMGWNLDYRYKLLGKLVRSNGELLFVFNLNNPEIYERFYREGEKPRVSRTPVYPDEWKNQFGVSVEEHKRSLSINTFSDYTIFGVRDTAPKQQTSESSDNQESTYGYEH